MRVHCLKIRSHLASTSTLASNFNFASVETLILMQRMDTEPNLCICNLLPLLLLFSKTQTQMLTRSVHGSYGVFTLSYSGTGTETGTGTGKNGLYGFDKSLSHCTWTGTVTGTGKNTNGCYTHFSGPENVPGPEY